MIAGHQWFRVVYKFTQDTWWRARDYWRRAWWAGVSLASTKHRAKLLLEKPEITHLESVTSENPPEECPHVPPLMGVLQQDGLNVILVILGLLIRTVLNMKKINLLHLLSCSTNSSISILPFLPSKLDNTSARVSLSCSNMINTNNFKWTFWKYNLKFVQFNLYYFYFCYSCYFLCQFYHLDLYSTLN